MYRTGFITIESLRGVCRDLGTPITDKEISQLMDELVLHVHLHSKIVDSSSQSPFSNCEFYSHHTGVIKITMEESAMWSSLNI